MGPQKMCVQWTDRVYKYCWKYNGANPPVYGKQNAAHKGEKMVRIQEGQVVSTPALSLETTRKVSKVAEASF